MHNVTVVASYAVAAYAVTAVSLLFVADRLGWLKLQHCTYPDNCPECKAQKRPAAETKLVRFTRWTVQALFIGPAILAGKQGVELALLPFGGRLTRHERTHSPEV